MTTIRKVCKYCHEVLCVGPHNVFTDEHDFPKLHHCFAEWAEVNKTLGHQVRGKALQHSHTSEVLRELRAGPTTFEGLRLQRHQICETVSKLRHEGMDIHSELRETVTRLGLHTRQWVYWLAVVMVSVVACLPFAHAAFTAEFVPADSEKYVQCGARARLVGLAAFWAAKGLPRESFSWDEENVPTSFARDTKRDVDAVWGPAARGEDAKVEEMLRLEIPRCLGEEV